MIDRYGLEYLAVMRELRPTRMSPHLDELYTLGETAEILRTSRRTVRRLLADTTLAGHKIGGT